MCGIAGIVAFRSSNADKAALARMVACERHRGPDADGLFCRDGVGLGHRRLSIIDIAGGAQPFVEETGNFALTYNGELYNYKELRDELAGKGHAFRTASDTEVVLRAYQEWGTECPKRFQGMFAFAVADFIKGEIFLARDHFGIKPLVYYLDDERFAFASELNALAHVPGWADEINLSAVDQYLRFQFVPEPETIFRKTWKLPAAHWMTIQLRGSKPRLKRYWSPEFAPEARSTGAGITDDQIDETLRDSVRRHLVADVPFGAFLSGGVDSSLVVGYMAQLLPQPVKTFSIGFDDSAVSELKEAEKVARHYGTDHSEEIVTASALSVLPQIVQHYGEPFGDQSAVPTWYVSKLARGSVPMVLSGDGGDELFGGYGRYGGWMRRLHNNRPAPEPLIRGAALSVARRFFPRRYETPQLSADDPKHWMDFVGRLEHPEREALWRPEYRFVTDSPDHAVLSALKKTKGSSLSRARTIDLLTFLPGDILTKVDIASMAFGLEVRTPLLDTGVFAVASRISPRKLFSVDEHGEYSGKLPLKRILARYMGPAFANRTKAGFELPLRSWLYGSESSRSEVQERLISSGSALRDWFLPQGIERVIQRERPVDTWLLIVLEEWLRQHRSRRESLHQVA